MRKHEEQVPKPAAHFLHSIQEQEILPEQFKCQISPGIHKPERINKPEVEVIHLPLLPNKSTIYLVYLGINLNHIPHSTSLPEAGCLQFCQHNWTCLTSDPWIFQTVMEVGTTGNPEPAQATSPNTIAGNQTESGVRGNQKAVCKEGCDGSTAQNRPISEPVISSPKEG